MRIRFKNTLQKGSIRYIVFREANVWYAVGLEFNIVESGDTPREALILLFESIQGYVESAQKIKARPHILNQKTDPEYETMWQAVQEGKRPSHTVYTSGEMNLSLKQKDLAFV